MYAIPVGLGKSMSGLGLHYLKQHLSSAFFRKDEEATHFDQYFSPCVVSDAADNFRLFLQTNGQITASDRAGFKQNIRELQGMHDALMARNVRNGAMAYKLEYVVN